MIMSLSAGPPGTLSPRANRRAAGLLPERVALMTLGGFLFLNTLYLQDVRGYSALNAGLLTIARPNGSGPWS